MHKLLKFPWQEKDRHFFSSDWHIFHDPKWDNPIWNMRGYSSAEDAAQKTLEKINERVGEDDIIWYLGDMFLNATDEQCLEWLNKIKCKNVYFVYGNHESNIHRLYKQEVLKQFGRDDIEVYPLKMGNVTFLGDYQEIQIGKKHIVCCHYSLNSWHKMMHGSWHICGHSHSDDKTINPDYPIGKVIDSGWDWKKDLWSVDEISEIMAAKQIKAEGHHV